MANKIAADEPGATSYEERVHRHGQSDGTGTRRLRGRLSGIMPLDNPVTCSHIAGGAAQETNNNPTPAAMLDHPPEPGR
jgi:hypothetical protein